MDNVISMEKKLRQKKLKNMDKKAQEHISYLFQKSQELAPKYIDGNFDNQFKSFYKQGAGSDEDFFGKCFAQKIISYTVKKLRESKEDTQAQHQIMKNFGLAAKGLLGHVMKPTVENFKSQISDSVTGLDNYQDLANTFNAQAQEDSSYYDCRKVIIDDCFKVTVKTALRRVK